jgi:uncharacterized protein
VKFNVRDIEASAKELRCDEPTHDLSRLLTGPVQDYRLPTTLAVHVQYYRAGADLFFLGRVDGEIVGSCARCLEEYNFPLALDFSFVFVPHSELRGERGVEEDDTDLSYYEGEEVDISPLLHENILLALPTRPLCRDNCAGLCFQCGVNRNLSNCGCRSERTDPRLAVLRTLKIHS